MRTLYLLRHAKSISSEGSMKDFDRPLSSTGKVQAENVAHLLTATELGRALVLSSPAVRARETTEIVLATAGLSQTPHFESRIYDADVSTLLDLIQQIDDVNELAILVGHNPGMEGLLRHFTGEMHAVATAGLSKIILETDSWRGAANASARLECLLTP
jgi:phosphohistidine phosphatase